MIEDDESVGKTTCRLLERLGCDTLWLSNGEDGLREVRERPVDLVLVDFGLPGRNGVSIAESMRALKPDIPIVLFSGWPVELDQTMLRRAGIHKALGKPVTKEELEQLLADLLHR
ncbi:MAG: response regulator [Dehalococcoidia bacterium]